MRLKNISLRTTLKKLEKAHRAKDQLADGLHIIDFEQLKSENSTLRSKAEERHKDLIKLDKTKTTDMKVLNLLRRILSYLDFLYFVLISHVHFALFRYIFGLKVFLTF